MKKILLATIACLFLFGNQALAHTGLESSNPANGSTVTEQLKEITLSFESKIEQTSSFELKNANNEVFPINNLNVSESSMTGSVDQLNNGDYTIVWKIIGADGHPIQGEVAFTLNAPIVDDTTVEEEVTETEIEETTKQETTEPETTSNVSATTDTKDSSNKGTIGIVVVLVLVLAGSAWWMARRKNK